MNKRTKKEVEYFLNNLNSYPTEQAFVNELFHLFYLTNCDILKISTSRSRRFHCTERRNLTRGKIGIIDLIKCGILDDMKTYILKSTNVKDQSVNIYKTNEFNGPNIQDLVKPIDKWIGCDEFTNETIINWVLNFVIKDYSTKQHFAFVCNKIGYQIQEKADSDLSGYINSSKFNPKNLDKMIFQVVSQLDFLEKNYNFIHGDMKTKNVLVYKNGKLAKISDYGKSSLTINGYRFYCRLDEKYKRSILGIFATSSLPKNKVYRYNLSDLDTVVAMRHRREIFYLNFDIYTFMVSIALEKRIFYDFVVGNSKGLDFFHTFWNFLWVNEKTKKLVQKRIAALLLDENINLHSYNPLLGILKNLDLKYF